MPRILSDLTNKICPNRGCRYNNGIIATATPKPLSSPSFPYFFSINPLKLFPLSYNQKSLMKHDIFDPKPSPSSCYTLILSIILSCSALAYK